MHHAPRTPQLVTVVSDCRLIDAHGNECLYWRRDGRGLAPGVYVAIPQTAGRRRFGEHTVFDGPFARPADAEAALAGAGTATAPARAKLPSSERSAAAGN